MRRELREFLDEAGGDDLLPDMMRARPSSRAFFAIDRWLQAHPGATNAEAEGRVLALGGDLPLDDFLRSVVKDLAETFGAYTYEPAPWIREIYDRTRGR